MFNGELQEQYDYLYRLAVRATEWRQPPPAESDSDAEDNNNVAIIGSSDEICADNDTDAASVMPHSTERYVTYEEVPNRNSDYVVDIPL